MLGSACSITTLHTTIDCIFNCIFYVIKSQVITMNERHQIQNKVEQQRLLAGHEAA
jgi:hypothetical protein